MCPPYVFKVPLTIPFITETYSHNVTYVNLRTKNEKIMIPATKLSTVGTDEDHDREMRLIQTLKKETEELNKPLPFDFHRGALTIPLPTSWEAISLWITVVGSAITIITWITKGCRPRFAPYQEMQMQATRPDTSVTINTPATAVNPMAQSPTYSLPRIYPDCPHRNDIYDNTPVERKC